MPRKNSSKDFFETSYKNDHELIEQLGRNEVQSVINVLKCILKHEKISEAKYVTAHYTVCISVDVFIQLYHDAETYISDNKDDYDSKKI